MNSQPNVVSIAAWSARRVPEERSDLSIVPRDGRCRQGEARTPGPVGSAARGRDRTVQFSAGGIVQFRSPGIGTSHGDPADALTGPTSGTRALAMHYSDQWIREGCQLDSTLIDHERAALVGSYAALLTAVDNPQRPLPSRSRRGKT